MKMRVRNLLLCAGLIAVAAFTALTIPASAQLREVTVRLGSGELLTLTVDVPPGVPLSEIDLPGVGGVDPGTPAPAPKPVAPPPQPGDPAPVPGAGEQQPSGGDRRPAGGNTEPVIDPQAVLEGEAPAPDEIRRDGGARPQSSPMREADGSPAPSNPGFMDALPSSSFTTGVPNFVIDKFRVPPFLLSIYIAAGIEYGVRWEVLAAINEIETDYGRNLNVSSAGALGWMQFIPSSWRAYGVDGNKDGTKDPYNPVDAIFAAANYLDAAGYEDDERGAIFAYNHADWYVNSVLLRARVIEGVPERLVGSLTGLTQGRFPVAARATYADDLQEREVIKRVEAGENAANVIESEDDRRSVDIFAAKGAPVIATNDGEIVKVGRSEELGRYVVLQDVYGNRYTYGRLGSVAKFYPVPKEDAANENAAKAIPANSAGDDPEPSSPASAGSQPDVDDSDGEPRRDRRVGSDGESAASIPIKERLFAHPGVSGARDEGGLEQILDKKARSGGGVETYRNYFSRPFGADAKDIRLRRLKKGSRVIGGTIIGRVAGSRDGMASHVEFGIRPAGRGAPRINPKVILDGWKLLEATAIYRPSGRNVLYGSDGADGFSIGQALLLPKPLLERRVLSDERIDIYEGGRSDIRTGQIDRRVLAAMLYLADRGLRPTVTSLKSGHGFYTSSGNVSHHSSGNAVDIAQINDVPILGHQERGGVTDQAVRELMKLQGTIDPDQIISLIEIGGPTIAMADHADHIHVGFTPQFGTDGRLERQDLAVLEPGQWSDLLERLGEIENPEVSTEPSEYALPANPHKRSSEAHSGE